jgi:hypothetical protein
MSSTPSINKGSVMAITEELGYNKVCALMDVHKDTRKATASDHLHHHRTRGEGFLLKNVIGNETCVNHYITESKQQLKDWKHITSLNKKKFKECVTSRKNCCYGLLA